MTSRPLGAFPFSLLLLALAVLGGCPTPAPPPPPKPPTAKPPPPRPQPQAHPNPMVALASRSNHNCAIRKTGDVLCWGSNNYGQLGNGKRDDSARYVKVARVADATKISVGINFSCVIRKGGTLLCWGNNEDGQLGDGRGGKPGVISLTPARVASVRGATQISLGERHACALDSGGAVYCWGNAGNGQIGDDSKRAFAMPRKIDRLGPAKEVASGAYHVCALERTGTVKCWGRNTEGQLGDGKSGSRIKPVAVAGLEDATSIASGHNHTCALRKRGEIVCWGDNKMRQLGPAAGREAKRNTPIAVKGVSGVVELAGGGAHTCARTNSGRVYCWGANEQAQLGHKATPKFRAQPTVVRGLADATQLAAGTEHTCALRKTGEVMCWGNTKYGAVGPHRLL